MTKEEFKLITKGSLQEAIVRASLYLRLDLPQENICLIGGEHILAEGWEASVSFLTDNMYASEQLIKPCADLIVDDFDETTVIIRVFISGHQPRSYSLNWSGGVGPYIKGINSKLIQTKAQKEFPDK